MAISALNGYQFESCDNAATGGDLDIESFHVQSTQGDKLMVGITYGQLCDAKTNFLASYSCISHDVDHCDGTNIHHRVSHPACIVIFCHNLAESCHVNYSFKVSPVSPTPSPSPSPSPSSDCDSSGHTCIFSVKGSTPVLFYALIGAGAGLLLITILVCGYRRRILLWWANRKAIQQQNLSLNGPPLDTLEQPLVEVSTAK